MNQSSEPINNFSETENLSDEATKEIESADESSVSEIVPLQAVENIELPETIELFMEKETELLKTDNFTISILVKELKPGKDSDSYGCELYVIDSQVDKSFLDNCEIDHIGQIDNPIVCYNVLDRENPLVCADINNNKITDYLFILNGSNSDVLIGFEKKNEKYVLILNHPVQTDGGPECDIVAENIIFNYGKKFDEIIIDTMPYNGRSHLSFDKDSYRYTQKTESPYTLQQYFPDESLEVKQIGIHEIASNDQRIYLKNQDNYYKICFLGDPETFGYAFSEGKLGVYDINIQDVDDSSFIVQLSFLQDEKKDQFFYIFKNNDQWYIKRTLEQYNNIAGIYHEYDESLEIKSAKNENGNLLINYDVVDRNHNVIESKSTVIEVDNLDY